jgi:predicted HTH transcriptional regulator
MGRFGCSDAQKPPAAKWLRRFVHPNAALLRGAVVIKHPQRAEAERVWNFPYAAIEEAVVNAVYHRSHEEREPIEVRIDRSELVVLSFPGPDRSIKLADLQAGRAVSRRYRNRRIGEFLKELDLTEGRATGIPKILKVMAANGSPTPVFESDDERTSFVIRLPVHARAAAVPQAPESKSPGKSPEKWHGFWPCCVARCRAKNYNMRWVSSTETTSTPPI